MNIIEAIKSGRRFRRKYEKNWYSPISDNYPMINISAISRENFLADDWEIEGKTVTITREQFDKAVVKWLMRMCQDDDRFFDAVADELGL